MILIWQWITPGSNTLPKSQTMHQRYPPSRADRMPRNYIQCHMRAWVDSCFRFLRFKKKKKTFFTTSRGAAGEGGVQSHQSHKTKEKKWRRRCEPRDWRQAVFHPRRCLREVPILASSDAIHSVPRPSLGNVNAADGSSPSPRANFHEHHSLPTRWRLKARVSKSVCALCGICCS